MHVLRRLDLEHDVLQRGSEPDAIDIRTARDGNLLTSIALKDCCRSRYGAPYIVIHRADLLEILINAAGRHDGIAILTGSPVSEVSSKSDRVCFGVGAQRRSADLLIASDGVHSGIRNEMTGSGAKALSQIAWRSTVKKPRSDSTLLPDRTGLWLGRGAHLVHYAIRKGQELNLVLIGHAASGSAEELLTGFHGPLRDAIAEVDWSPWPLYRVDTSNDWYRERIVLLGDAAHAMLPTSAQGGAQAIEDAFVLATCLEKSPGNPDAALALWQNRRRKRVERIAAQAADNLRIYKLGGLAASARNLAIRSLPAGFHLSRLDWLYGWQPD